MRTVSTQLWRLCVFGLSLAAFEAAPLAGQDFLLHAAGDSINGDVKRLSRGRLNFSIPGSRTFSVDWRRVRGLGSADLYEVVLVGGQRLVGSLAPGPEDFTMQILGTDAAAVVSMVEVVSIIGIEDRVWSRFDGFLEFGFSFFQATTAISYSLQAEVEYRAYDDELTLSAGSFLQDQADAEATRRTRADLVYRRYLPRRWAAGAIVQAETNQQLDLDLRGLFGVAGGRDLIRSNNVAWHTYIGAAYTRERYFDVPSDDSFEGILGSTFDWFTFGGDETDVSAQLLALPSLSISGRWRIDFDVRARQELLSDFYVSLSVYDQFDSLPPTDGRKNDLGTTIALGWSF